MEFIFHGTGTSSALPLVPCITSHPAIKDIECRCCREAIASFVPPGETDQEKQEREDVSVHGGERNKRGNTGGVVRKRGSDGEWRTIVIDVGKTFRDQATWLFRKHQIRRIDAVILTHGHQDAIAGLDDLRAFTAPPSPQAGAVIPIYLSRATLDAVAQQFPYLVDKNQATGGGDVPSLDFRVFDDPAAQGDVTGVKGQSMADGFDVHGVWVVPLAVHHGKYFTPPDKVERLDVPERQSQTAPQTPPQVLQSAANEAQGRNAIQPSLTSLLHRKIEETVKETVPFYCYGFVFDGKMIYLSDVSYIPTGTWEKMITAIQPGTATGLSPSPTNDTIGPSKLPFSSALGPSSRTLPCLILDCLRLEPHGSHLSFIQALSICMHLSPRETYLVGFTHPNSHDEWVAGCREVQGTRTEGEEEEFLAAVQKSAVRQGEVMSGVWERAKAEWKGFVRPAFDGQVLHIE